MHLSNTGLSCALVILAGQTLVRGIGYNAVTLYAGVIGETTAALLIIAFMLPSFLGQNCDREVEEC